MSKETDKREQNMPQPAATKTARNLSLEDLAMKSATSRVYHVGVTTYVICSSTAAHTLNVRRYAPKRPHSSGAWAFKQ